MTKLEADGDFGADGNRVKCQSCGGPYDVKRKYGLEWATYEQMLEEQRFSCWTCLRPFDMDTPGDVNVDHCHNSGSVRGLLCGDCNTALGRIKDDPAVARMLALYLEHFGYEIIPDGGTEADGDQGETWEPPVKGFDLLRVSESDDETPVTGGLYGDKVIDLPDTPAAEPDRATLPDTPWTTVRVTFESGSQEVWRTNALRGFWMKNDHAVVVKPHKAELTEVTILAQPPEADAAETDAPAPINDWRAYVDGKVGVAIDIARDEALAEFYSALDVAYARATPETAPDELMRLLRALIADAIEREAGGDGHE